MHHLSITLVLLNCENEKNGSSETRSLKIAGSANVLKANVILFVHCARSQSKHAAEALDSGKGGSD